MTVPGVGFLAAAVVVGWLAVCLLAAAACAQGRITGAQLSAYVWGGALGMPALGLLIAAIIDAAAGR